MAVFRIQRTSENNTQVDDAMKQKMISNRTGEGRGKSV